MRVGLGCFSPNEYDDFRVMSIFSSQIPFGMADEWLLFKNIHRRSGQYGWFWDLVAWYHDLNNRRD
ncbi:MAG: hypothetical protein KC777_03715 [Cyanobacteria bacterium HKST-UBA02]|nr:hypothetical protein [Cyanobacteria bacterium HKST-UBA02]